ncbi:MAG: hypothetical protein OJF58_002102 [Enhydrobacter sp.]|nr:MAG: hypothetical protein OJF58_002102 [Enhydrobacter sp.]
MTALHTGCTAAGRLVGFAWPDRGCPVQQEAGSVMRKQASQ